MTSAVLSAYMDAKPWVSSRTAQDLLLYIHFAYPPLLLALFLVAFTVHSIVTASKDTTIAVSPDQTGPGGKPLPKNTGPSARSKKTEITDFSRARKLLFDLLSVGVILTFVGNAVVVILHALIYRKDNWWCGQSVAVGFTLRSSLCWRMSY